ncbi:MAG TPA: class I SAM-dependent methyltransferase [Gammaproteobacteria bacterium]|nr:class I SAM-dependent methyltransferase [Gammaproteobacteria bacterium]
MRSRNPMSSLRRKSAAKRSSRPSMAQRADRYDLYQRSVQDPEWEVGFMAATYGSLRGRSPLSLREDFCGTALFACEWVKSDRRRTAVGVDMDGAVLAWGREHNLVELPPAAAARLTLLQADVLEARTPAVDILAAFNFSYWVFKERATLRRYFERARAALAEGGIFMLDAYGGYDAQRVMREREDLGRFIYVWDQAGYDPVTSGTTCHIHFAFPDGSRLNQAFSYHWRLWSLAELREVLAEAGFGASTVYWQGTDPKTGEGTDEFKPVQHGDPDPAWIAYIVAEK